MHTIPFTAGEHFTVWIYDSMLIHLPVEEHLDLICFGNYEQICYKPKSTSYCEDVVFNFFWVTTWEWDS